MVEARPALAILPFGVEDGLILDPDAEHLEETIELAVLLEDVVEQVLGDGLVPCTVPLGGVRRMAELGGCHGLFDGGGEQPGNVQVIVNVRRRRSLVGRIRSRHRGDDKIRFVERTPRVVDAETTTVQLSGRDSVLTQREASERKSRHLPSRTRLIEPSLCVLDEVESRRRGDV